MLHTYARPAGRSETDPSPTDPHRLSPRKLAAVQRNIRACRATIASSQQRCRHARALVEAATERIVCSQRALATSRATAGCGSGGSTREH
jgi:hypothetical protein